MTGYEIANQAIVGGLQALGHAVICIGFQLPRHGEADGDAVVLHRGNLENARAGRLEKISFIGRALARGLPVSASKLRVVSEQACRDAVAKAGPFEAVIANSYQMAAAFPGLIADRPFGYLAHNVEYISARENAVRAASAAQRFFYRRDARLLHTIETDLVKRAAWTWTLSVEDAGTLSVPDPTAAMLPLAVPNVDVIASSAAPAFDTGMIGTWTWQPNRVGLEWFFTKVVPMLDRGTTIAVAGAVPDDLSVPDSVTMLGRVDSASAFLSSLRVVPLVSRGGTGVQLKTIEALQSGLTCVATPSAMRGVADVPDHCSVLDDASAFAAALNNRIATHRSGTVAGSKSTGRQFGEAQERAMIASLETGLRALRDAR